MVEGNPDGPSGGGPPDRQRESARSLLESVVDTAAPGGTVEFRSTDYGPSNGTLGFSYRDGSLMVEYQDDVNAAGAHPDTTAASSKLMELNDHTPLSAADEEYAAVEQSVIELVAETVADVSDEAALEPVTVWPVANDPGLYRVGYEITEREFLYAVAFKILPSAMK